ncbi:hypothetical protein SAMN05720758_2441 [Fibrobacter sp. UWB11]|nr:hypothetical protein SAMN05720758_2441 [Fibrobacter sp. UWB11]
MGEAKMFHVKHLDSPNISFNTYVRAVHDFQAGTIIEGNESAGKLFCRVVVNWVDYPAEVFPVELTYPIDVFNPDGNMFNLHKMIIWNNIINIHKSDLFAIII